MHFNLYILCNWLSDWHKIWFSKFVLAEKYDHYFFKVFDRIKLLNFYFFGKGTVNYLHKEKILTGMK